MFLPFLSTHWFSKLNLFEWLIVESEFRFKAGFRQSSTFNRAERLQFRSWLIWCYKNSGQSLGREMRDSRLMVVTIVATGIAATLFSTSTHAGSLPFPGIGTNYTSTTDGSGLIPSGGKSGEMSTAGDSVDETFTGVPFASVDSISASFNIDDALNGSSETVFIDLNGIFIGSFTVPDAGGVNTLFPVAGSAFFSPIVGNGTYELTMTLQDTVGADGGFIDFQDGGSFALDGGVRVTSVPEPLTLSLLGDGLVGAIVMRRRKRKAT